MKQLLSILIVVLLIMGCSTTPSQVETRYSTNNPCVTKKANCTPAEAAQYAALERRTMILEERQHQAEIRAIDNRITDNARISDMGK